MEEKLTERPRAYVDSIEIHRKDEFHMELVSDGARFTFVLSPLIAVALMLALRRSLGTEADIIALAPAALLLLERRAGH